MDEKVKCVGPITPAEAKSQRAASIPPEVFEAFNKLIVENLSSDGGATFTQDSVIDILLRGYLPECRETRRRALFDLGYLDVEDVYRAAGWKVTYDKPAYNEEGKARFTFQPTLRRVRK